MEERGGRERRHSGVRSQRQIRRDPHRLPGLWRGRTSKGLHCSPRDVKSKMEGGGFPSAFLAATSTADRRG